MADEPQAEYESRPGFLATHSLPIEKHRDRSADQPGQEGKERLADAVKRSAVRGSGKCRSPGIEGSDRGHEIVAGNDFRDAFRDLARVDRAIRRLGLEQDRRGSGRRRQLRKDYLLCRGGFKVELSVDTHSPQRLVLPDEQLLSVHVLKARIELEPVSRPKPISPSTFSYPPRRPHRSIPSHLRYSDADQPLCQAPR
jgi:hypothetical protein